MPEEVLLLANHLSGVQSDPDAHHLATRLVPIGRQVTLDRNRAAERIAGRWPNAIMKPSPCDLTSKPCARPAADG